MGVGEVISTVGVLAFVALVTLVFKFGREAKEWKRVAQGQVKVIEKVQEESRKVNVEEKNLHGTVLLERQKEMSKTGVTDKFIDDLERDLKKVKDE